MNTSKADLKPPISSTSTTNAVPTYDAIANAVVQRAQMTYKLEDLVYDSEGHPFNWDSTLMEMRGLFKMFIFESNFKGINDLMSAVRNMRDNKRLTEILSPDFRSSLPESVKEAIRPAIELISAHRDEIPIWAIKISTLIDGKKPSEPPIEFAAKYKEFQRKRFSASEMTLILRRLPELKNYFVKHQSLMTITFYKVMNAKEHFDKYLKLIYDELNNASHNSKHATNENDLIENFEILSRCTNAMLDAFHGIEWRFNLYADDCIIWSEFAIGYRQYPWASPNESKSFSEKFKKMFTNSADVLIGPFKNSIKA